MKQTLSIGDIGITFNYSDPAFTEHFQFFKPFFSEKETDITITLEREDQWPEFESGDPILGTDIIKAEMGDHSVNYRAAGLEGIFNFKTMKAIFKAYPASGPIDFAVRAAIVYGALFFDAILIHSSAVYNEDYGIVGTGISGAGKTTLAKTLSQFDYTILHDDANLIRRVGDQFYLYPTPIKTLNVTATIPEKPILLTHLFFLGKTEKNWTEELPEQKKISLLSRMLFSYSSLSQMHYIKFFDFFENLSKSIIIQKLNYNPKTLNPSLFLK